MALNEDKQMVLAFMAEAEDVDPISGNEVKKHTTTDVINYLNENFKKNDKVVLLSPIINSTKNSISKQIEINNKSDDVVLYMKGDPTFPQCGFSSTVVQILKHLGIAFKSYDVLQNENLREGIKAFSNWPTIPQLYVKGEFVGGCDIIREMFEKGELKKHFEDNSIKVEI